MANEQAILDRIRKLEQRRVELAQQPASSSRNEALRKANMEINELQLKLMPK